MKLFFDMEFTGLNQNAQIISVAFCAEDGQEFYAESSEIDPSTCDEWIQENVIWSTRWIKKENVAPFASEEKNPENLRTLMTCFGPEYGIKNTFLKWVKQYDSVEIWGDCLAYDWVLFCELFGGALNVPKNIYYIPFDICTLFKVLDIDPDTDRFAFAEMIEDERFKHNSLYDARAIRRCYRKIDTLQR